MNLTLATDDRGEPEIFASLQGEGPSAGKPCSFIHHVIMKIEMWNRVNGIGLMT